MQENGRGKRLEPWRETGSAGRKPCAPEGVKGNKLGQQEGFVV
jgi:hypothetical protein